MTKWHLRADTSHGTACGRRGDLTVGPEDFRGLIASARCERCERLFVKEQRPALVGPAVGAPAAVSSN